ncbi:hypothetical protein CRG98_001254, partial [Punica granatum]
MSIIKTQGSSAAIRTLSPPSPSSSTSSSSSSAPRCAHSHRSAPPHPHLHSHPHPPSEISVHSEAFNGQTPACVFRKGRYFDAHALLVLASSDTSKRMLLKIWPLRSTHKIPVTNMSDEPLTPGKFSRCRMPLPNGADNAACMAPNWIGKGLTCVCFKRKGTYERICISLTPLQ